ncbi:MAG: AbrB/MazE/SpoVT family DNA-binding domain-containing protein [Candidatus Diapherotrites archaeon]
MIFLEAEVVVRKWGNSLGLTLPKNLVETQKIRENDRISIQVEKNKLLRVGDIFGLAKGWKFDTQKFKDQARREELERERKISGFLRNH